MNSFHLLSRILSHINRDNDLRPSHFCLYLALFAEWHRNQFQNPIRITRIEMMKLSKISSVATYHKCIRDLHQKGIIIYKPSFHPQKGSEITLTNLKTE